MNRRDVIIATLKSVTALSAMQILVQCGSSNSSSTGDQTFASTSASGHTHTFTITAAELAANTALDRNDSTASGHAHRVQISSSEMAQISAGNTVTRQSDSASNHQHTYTFRRA